MGTPDLGGPAEGGSAAGGLAAGDSAVGGLAAAGSAVSGSAVADAAMDDFALDGNAIGGMLMEIFGSDMTMAVAICGSCGAVGRVAELAVYMPGPGTVVRCRNCGAVLMVFVRIGEVTCVDLEGLASLS
jgi:Family of unknown function (DUF6510)